MHHLNKDAAVPFDFDGINIHDFAVEGVRSGSVAELEVPRGGRHRVARSTHSDKFYVCLEGEVSFWVEGGAVLLAPQDLLVILRGERFSYRNEGQHTARMLLFHAPAFDPAGEEFLDDAKTEVE